MNFEKKKMFINPLTKMSSNTYLKKNSISVVFLKKISLFVTHNYYTLHIRAELKRLWHDACGSVRFCQIKYNRHGEQQRYSHP